jgi:hypothetical protein
LTTYCLKHYPKSKKYISIFPPEARQRGSEGQHPVFKTDTAKTDAIRDEVRQWIRERMDKGELEREPELHLDARAGSGNKKSGTEWGAVYDVKAGKGSKGEGGKESNMTTAGGGVEADAFFGDDDTEEDEDESG